MPSFLSPDIAGFAGAFPKILVIGRVWPEPSSSAAGWRMLRFLRHFVAQGSHVHYATTSAPSEHAVDMQALGVVPHAIAVNDSGFDTWVRALNPDLVLFDRFMMEEQFGWRVAEQCPGALRVLDTVDLHCLRRARHEALKAHRPMQADDLLSDTAKREIAAILRCDLAFILSEPEMRLLRETFRVDPALLHTLPLIVPAIDAATRQAWPAFEAREGLVFIGNFLHEPNGDAVQHLHGAIWPLLRKRLPDAELRIYGAYPTPKAMALHRPRDRFHVLGRADDALAVLAQARLCLAPLRFGAGLKGKLAEAMRAGTPSLTTAIGAEGMQGDTVVPETWPGAIAETPEAFAEAAVALYRDRNAWLAAQEKGVALLHARFARPDLEALGLQRLVTLKRDLETHRRTNFLGAMLQHHTLASTRHLARWIEAKNKCDNQS